MKKLVLLPLMALFVVAGCQDLQKDSMTEAKAAAGPASLSIDGDGETGPTTVCLAYGERLDALNAQLAEDPANEDLQLSVQQFSNVLAAECQ